MGFSYRKSINVGPARINISKSGIGASVGPKGARAGINSKGTSYIRGGINGVYFNRYLTEFNASGHDSYTTIVEYMNLATELRDELIVLVNDADDEMANLKAEAQKLQERLDNGETDESNAIHVLIEIVTKGTDDFYDILGQCVGFTEDLKANLREMNEWAKSAPAHLLPNSFPLAVLKQANGLNNVLDSVLTIADETLHKYETVLKIYSEKIEPTIEKSQFTSKNTEEGGEIGTQIEKLVQLRDSNDLTEEEFEIAKKKLLG